MSSSDAYREKIMDHDRNPRNKRWLEGADIEAHGSNPVCGDDISIQIRLDGEKIKEIAFAGRGCAISQGTASMLTELARGRDLSWAESTPPDEIFGMFGLGDHRKARASCELLGIKALKNGVAKYRSSCSKAQT